MEVVESKHVMRRVFFCEAVLMITLLEAATAAP